MTFEEKQQQLLEDRANALLGKKTILMSEISLNEEKDFNDKYLFGDGINLGIVNFLELYYQELNKGVGRTNSTPSMSGGIGSSKAAWISQLENASTLDGDGSLYLDSNSDGVANDTINESSTWLTNNGDNGQTNGGIIPLFSPITNAIGTAATATGERGNAIGDSTSEADAKATAVSRAESEKGTNLLGKRTQDTDGDDETDSYEFIQYTDPDPEPARTAEISVFEKTTPGPPPDPDPNPDIIEYYYKIGLNGADHPDYYQGSERTAFELSLNNLMTGLQNYRLAVIQSKEELIKINNNTNTLLSESNIKSDIDLTEITSLTSLEASLDNVIASLQIEIDYFEALPTGYDRTTFNNKINTTIPSLISTINTLISDRATVANSKLNLGDITNGLRKWLFFWIKENIKKPLGPYIGLSTISQALSKANSTITIATDAAEKVADDISILLPTPRILAAYYKPELDNNNQISLIYNELLWIGSQGANKYKIFRRKLVNNSYISNSSWPDADLYTWHEELKEDSLVVNSKYVDYDVLNGETFLYRVQTFDEATGRMGASDTYSLQSKVYDENEISIVSITNGLINLNEEHEFTSGSYLLLLNSNNDGFYYIQKVSTDGIQLEDKTINGGAATIHYVFGMTRILI